MVRAVFLSGALLSGARIIASHAGCALVQLVHALLCLVLGMVLSNVNSVCKLCFRVGTFMYLWCTLLSQCGCV